jgi:hypothetical protein
MADMNFDQFEGGYGESPAAPRRFGKLLHLAGAACSLALVASLGLWGYKLAVRDVTGIPVIRAMEGPMRIAPDAPGGNIVSNQGLSVNAVAASGIASAMPESLVLAPRPVELALDDAAGLISLTEDPATATTAPPELAPIDARLEVAPTSLPVPEADIDASQRDAVALALAEALAAGADPLAPLEPDPAAGVEVASLAPDGGVVSSLRPQRRPQAGTATTETATPTAALEIDAATVPIGTRLAQLGAFDDADLARAEWAKLQGQFGELLNGKAMIVQAAQSGGRTFYRLRAHGFEGEDDARRFCAALLAENASCIPVAQR